MDKTLVLTLDYELYGNGSGDVFEHMIRPTNEILSIVDAYGIKLTIFFEVVEYWRLKEEWNRGNRMGYDENPIAAIEEQLKRAYRNGHDIQLHLHPQWVDARYQDGNWVVNLEDWRLGGYDKEGEYSLKNLLIKGKKTIEDLIRPIDDEYRCVALRAGGYNIQPSQELVKAMKEVGLCIDSSIYPGGRELGFLSNYDYSAITNDLAYWQVGGELEQVGNNGVYELPIFALPILRFRKFLSLDRIKSLFRNRKSTKLAFEAKTSSTKNGILGKIKYFFETEWQTWDYCLFYNAMHRQFLRGVERCKNRDLFVLVGHPKSFTTDAGFKYLLKKTYGKYEYKTLVDIWSSKIK